MVEQAQNLQSRFPFYRPETLAQTLNAALSATTTSDLSNPDECARRAWLVRR